MVESKNSKNTLFCSFCGKSQHEVRKLIAGPTVFICDECVELCMDIIKEDNKNNKFKIKKDIPKPSEINKFLNANLDFSGTQQADVLKQLLAQAKEMGRTPEEVFREMAESIPLYSRFRANFPSVFRGIALAARKTNISISDLQKLTESLDTTEDAMKKAAKFNALLGGEFLNGLELLEAKPGDKVKLIARAYQRAQAAQGEIHPRVLRALYKEFGMDASSFKKMVGAEFGRFEEELAVAPKPTKMKQIEADIQQTLTAQEKLDNAIRLLSIFSTRLVTFITL